MIDLDSEFQTPEWCCDYMASLIPSSGVKKILEPTPGRGNLIAAILRRNPDYFVCGPDCFEAIPEGTVYDCIVMNPPFSEKFGYYVFDKCISMSDNIIALMPWALIINSSRRSKKIMDFGLRSITNLPRNTFPGSRVQCCVLHLSKGFKGVTEFLNIT